MSNEKSDSLFNETQTSLREDFRETKPKLHALYVAMACEHLTIIDRQIRELRECSNLNTHFVADAMVKAREELVQTNAAFEDANKILKLVKRAKRARKYRVRKVRQ